MEINNYYGITVRLTNMSNEIEFSAAVDNHPSFPIDGEIQNISSLIVKQLTDCSNFVSLENRVTAQKQ